MDLGLGSQIGESFRLAAQSSQRAVETSATSVSEGYSAAVREISSLMDRHGANTTVGSSTGTSDNVRSSGSLGSALNNVQQFAERHGVDQATAIRAALDAGLSGGASLSKEFGKFGLNAQARAGLNASGSVQGRDTDSYDQLVQSARSDQLGKELLTSIEANQGESAAESGSHGWDAQSGASASIDHLSSAISTHSSAVERAETLSRAAETFSSTSASDNTRLATAFMNYLGEQQGMTMAEISPIMNPKTTSEVAASQAHVGAFMRHVASEYGIGAETQSAFADGMASSGVSNVGPSGGSAFANATSQVKNFYHGGEGAIENAADRRGGNPDDLDQEFVRISRQAGATQDEIQENMTSGEAGIRNKASRIEGAVEDMHDKTTAGVLADKAAKATGIKQ